MINYFERLPVELLELIVGNIDSDCHSLDWNVSIPAEFRLFETLKALRQVSRVAAVLPSVNRRLFKHVYFYGISEHLDFLESFDAGGIGRYVDTLSFVQYPFSSNTPRRHYADLALSSKPGALRHAHKHRIPLTKRYDEQNYKAFIAQAEAAEACLSDSGRVQRVWTKTIRHMSNLKTVMHGYRRHLWTRPPPGEKDDKTDRGIWKWTPRPPDTMPADSSFESQTLSYFRVPPTSMLGTVLKCLYDLPTLQLRELENGNRNQGNSWWLAHVDIGMTEDSSKPHFPERAVSLPPPETAGSASKSESEPEYVKRTDFEIVLLDPVVSTVKVLAVDGSSLRHEGIFRSDDWDKVHLPQLEEITLHNASLHNDGFAKFLDRHKTLKHVTFRDSNARERDLWQPIVDALRSLDNLVDVTFRYVKPPSGARMFYTITREFKKADLASFWEATNW